MENNDCSCLSNILKLIDVLQRNSNRCPDEISGCTRPFLGNYASMVCYNTRPVTFYKCDGEILSINYGTGGETTSSVFRVEKVEGCCVRVLILIPNPDTTDPLRTYISTGEVATINLNCICAISCLPDVIIDC